MVIDIHEALHLPDQNLAKMIHEGSDKQEITEAAYPTTQQKGI